MRDPWKPSLTTPPLLLPTATASWSPNLDALAQHIEIVTWLYGKHVCVHDLPAKPQPTWDETGTLQIFDGVALLECWKDKTCLETGSFNWFWKYLETEIWPSCQLPSILVNRKSVSLPSVSAYHQDCSLLLPLGFFPSHFTLLCTRDCIGFLCFTSKSDVL